jgi:hypothetical protein
MLSGNSSPKQLKMRKSDTIALVLCFAIQDGNRMNMKAMGFILDEIDSKEKEYGAKGKMVIDFRKS